MTARRKIARWGTAAGLALAALVSACGGDDHNDPPATSDEVTDIRHENEQLKQVVAELLLKNRVLKKSVTGWESEREE